MNCTKVHYKGNSWSKVSKLITDEEVTERIEIYNMCSSKKIKTTIMPRVDYLADIHSRVYFCRDAALVRLENGMDKLACKDYGEDRDCSDQYDLYLDGVPLVRTKIPWCPTCGTILYAGYGNGLLNEEKCLAVRDKLNAEYEGMKRAVKNISPIIGLLKSDLYVVADFDLFPVKYHGGYSGYTPSYFWDKPTFSSYNPELYFGHLLDGKYKNKLDAPMFLAPSQRASMLNIERVNYYRKRIKEKEDKKFPRAVALYLNGGVALLLDGHHKAAACASEGIPVKTLVIFPICDARKLNVAVRNESELYLHHTKQLKLGLRVSPLAVKNGAGEIISEVSYLQRMEKTPVVERMLEEIDWGKAPDELYTQKYKNYPSHTCLISGTMIPTEQLRAFFDEEKAKHRGEFDEDTIKCLRMYSQLFPHSKWLSVAEREWLNRDDDAFGFKRPEW